MVKFMVLKSILLKMCIRISNTVGAFLTFQVGLWYGEMDISGYLIDWSNSP